MARKGITDIIAVVLLLMITISMVAFAWVWFSRSIGTITNKTDTSLDTKLNSGAQTIMIENIDKTSSPNRLSIRNTGTQNINTSYITIFIDSVAQSCTTWSTGVGTMSPGTVATCTAGLNLAGCSLVRVSAPGNTDEFGC